jgi:hypothetical protein
MRRSTSAAPIGTALIILVALTACGQPPTGKEEAPEPSSLFLRTSRGVSVIEPGASTPSFDGRNSVPSRDWSTVVRSKFVDGETIVTAVDPSTGVEHWSRRIDGRWDVKIVSEDGTVAALSPVREPFYQYGRRDTTLAIVRGDNSDIQTIALTGNYEPEAFSTDGRSVFVISYLPARRPSKYQVRRLDLNSEQVLGVYTPHEELQRAMGGTARIQAGSPDGKRLYTLYTVGRGNEAQAFIHVLDLDKLWAHCIDLPQGFGQDAEASTALSVSPDGGKLFVANSAAGMVAEVDTEALTVTNSNSVALGNGNWAHASSASDKRLYFANGRKVTSIDAAALSEVNTWEVDQRITGLQESADAAELYVGFTKDVDVLDPETGEVVETIDPPGVERIYQLGPEPPPIYEYIPKELACAC